MAKRLRELLGVDLPILQAPMAGVQDHALGVAVSNGGGLGSLPAAMLTPEGLRREMSLLGKGTTRPYNVNFFCHRRPTPDAGREDAWRALLSPYYKEFGIDPDTIRGGASRVPFGPEAADVLDEFKPPVVSFHFGLPSPDLLARVKAAGATILSSATTLEEARWLEARGVDAVIAQGLEAGGHRGHFLSDGREEPLRTAELVKVLVGSVSVPVIAAGGIADARGVASVMALGAAGVQVGTAYLLCPEATTSAVHRRALQGPGSRETAFTNLFSGRPARGIVNRLMRELGPMNEAAPEFPLASLAVSPLRAKAEAAGSGDFSPLWAGQNVAGCREIPAADLTRELAADL
jgi:nitronate monooxygenase